MAANSDSSPVLMTQLVLPSHTNSLGTIFGGVVMSWMDIAGAIAAQRYARSQAVTVSVDDMHFMVPIKIGYTVQIHAKVTWAGRTSMEVETLVKAENTITGEVREATRAFLTFVALDEFGRPKEVPAYTPKNEAEKTKFKEAEKRRSHRLKQQKLKSKS